MQYLIPLLLLLLGRPAEVSITTDRPGHLFTTDEKIRFRLTGVTEDRFTVTDAAGRRIDSARATATGGEVSVTGLQPGWYRLTATTGDAATVDFAVARPRSVQPFRESSPFGVAAPAKTPDEWKLQGDMGAAWLQWAIPWAYTETRPGVYWFTPGAPKYDDYEGYVKSANAYGIRTVLQFRTVPSWANKGRIGSYLGTDRGELHPPDDEHWDAFRNFTGVVADRFKPLGVRHYEMWGEAEGSLFQRWETPRYPKVEAYQKMLTEAKTALRAKDPSALLIAPGDGLIDLIRDVENGHTAPATFNGTKSNPYAGRSTRGIGRTTADIISGHFYWTDYASSPKRVYTPEQASAYHQGRTLAEVVGEFKRQAGARPVWNTEFGYGSARSEETPERMYVSEDEQANLLVRYYVLAPSWGVEKTFWYTWKDTASSSYGLLRADGTVKPAYIAYRTMTERLEGLKFDRLVESGPRKWIARYTGPRTVFVVWKTSGRDEEVTVPAPFARVRVTRRDGAEEVQAGGGQARITLRGGEPVYLDAAP
jgi:hypothetical protein